MKGKGKEGKGNTMRGNEIEKYKITYEKENY